MTVASISYLACPGPVPITDNIGPSEIITPLAGNTQGVNAATRTSNVARVTGDVNMYVSFGANPNALTDPGRFLLVAGAIEYRGIPAGHKTAVALA